jgi:ABC-type sugar transport system ATPase subunit
MATEYNTRMRVRFDGVSKRFGAHAALVNVNLEVQAGECLVLLGPSGCGKTTLLRLLAGLERADAGRIWIGDRVVNDIDPAQRDVAMVFQSYALYPHFTVFENIAFPLRARGLASQEVDRRVRAAAERVALG